MLIKAIFIKLCAARGVPVKNLTDDKGSNIPVNMVFSSAIVNSSLRYWFTDVNWDEKDHILSGYINMATSVQDLYTMRVTFSGQ